MSSKNKNDKYRFDNLLNEINEQYNDYITEKDFYPPTDDRVLKSYIKDISEEDNFDNYCKYIFELLEEEGYYD